jgi:RHS repeat-associated protein
MVIRITYPQPSVWLDLWGGTSGTFSGIDQFGRVINQLWQNNITGTPVAIDQYQYGYDQESNRLWKANVVGTAAVTSGLDEFYVYDPLNRLTEMQRGVLNSGKTGITGTPSVEQDWTLDPVGNWSGFVTKASGATTLNQTRTANTVNEITNITESTGPTWIVPAYDAAGNTITMPQPAAPTSSFTAVYDAWNRMVSISAGSTPVGKYQYDGRRFRIVKQIYASGVLSETRDVYFTAGWRDIQESVSGTMVNQYVWGIRYIDELICRDDATPERLYATQDANFNLTSITNTSGSVVERYLFDAYGTRIIMNASWGVIASSVYNLIIGFQGVTHDEESGLIYGRGRYVPTHLGVFTARDEASYTWGNNLYEYLLSTPPNKTDPSGMFTVTFVSGLSAAQQQYVSKVLDLISNRLANLAAQVTAADQALQNAFAAQGQSCCIKKAFMDQFQRFGGYITSLDANMRIGTDSLKIDSKNIGKPDAMAQEVTTWTDGYWINLNTGAKPRPWTAVPQDQFAQTLFHELTHTMGTDDGEAGDDFHNAHMIERLMFRDLDQWSPFELAIQGIQKCLRANGQAALADSVGKLISHPSSF